LRLGGSTLLLPKWTFKLFLLKIAYTEARVETAAAELADKIIEASSE